MEEKSLAWELLQDTKKANKRMFIIWIITFLALIGVTCYTIYLLNDIGTIEETDKSFYYMVEAYKDFTKVLFENAETPQQKQMLREAIQESMM